VGQAVEAAPPVLSLSRFAHGADGGGAEHGSLGFAAPGTLLLAMVFLVSFVLYYFVNWKYLSTVWGLS
jgi:cytochrome c oxidase subunit 1